MELLRFACATASRPSTSVAVLFLSNTQRKKKQRNACSIRAQLSDDNDPLLQSAINSASLRFQETRRPDPLFVDPYAGCFVLPHTRMDLENKSKQYCIATKFIDDKLLRTVNHIDGLKQVVLLSDGMDTRPYRLNWPSSTIIFDISPKRVFQKATEKLNGIGAKIPRRCLLLHVPLESPNIQETLVMKGFNGNRPSIWAIQGLPVMTLASFEEILLTASGMAMKGCLFLGELPAWLAETEFGNKSSTQKWMDNLFMSNGFKVEMISYDEVAKRLGKVVKPGDSENILFVAEQLRCSDDQWRVTNDVFAFLEKMETWRRELQRVEEDGDEEGFEEL
ncbi:putative S-adenosyl-L-methionine-dependent methyltransferase MMAR_0539 isoform X1 [Hibiscus syriacus]|uniref:putative S-adenosyl-L-methionine-dependent methyltransferase MMAR_0539 isoform X1 n=1 Tax=Hibiscus syriacus TaxID=106335 RepID=UPI0019232A14|nr:putative S-adenosyl-L-methionine-dependent methyltransferase MMAR_0539 isoform X1 [Hibiscus syriacus]